MEVRNKFFIRNKLIYLTKNMQTHFYKTRDRRFQNFLVSWVTQNGSLNYWFEFVDCQPCSWLSPIRCDGAQWVNRQVCAATYRLSRAVGHAQVHSQYEHVMTVAMLQSLKVCFVVVFLCILRVV